MQAFIYLPGVVTLMAAVCPKIVWRFDENMLNDAIVSVTVSVVLDTMFRRRHSESEHENWHIQAWVSASYNITIFGLKAYTTPKSKLLPPPNLHPTHTEIHLDLLALLLANLDLTTF